MSMTYELGELIAERQFDAVAEDGSRRPVVVRLGKPQRDTRLGDWCCPHQIVGLGDEVVRASFGVDSMQALLLGVYSLRLELAERAEGASVRFDWMGQSDLGLKVDPELHKLLPGMGDDPGY